MIDGVSVIVDNDVFDAMQENIRNAPKNMRTRFTRLAKAEKKPILKDLAYSRKRPKRPFVWSHNPAAQARARAWVFANLVPKGSKGGRYKRRGKSGGIVSKWQFLFNIDDEKGLIRLSNDEPGAVFVHGVRQVPSHKATGHPHIDDVVLKASERLNNKVIDLWLETADPFVGVK